MLKENVFYYEIEIIKNNNINLLMDITLDINVNPFISFYIKKNKTDVNKLLEVNTENYIINKDTTEYNTFFNKIFEINIPSDLVNNLYIFNKEFLYSYIEINYGNEVNESSEQNINKIIGYGKVILNTL